MALITDPDLLRRSTQAAGAVEDGEIYIDTTAKTIELISTTDWASSNLVPADGVTLQALYSKLKELWKSEADLIAFPFPMEAITSEQFEFLSDWELKDTTTASRTYIRNAGWTEKDATGTIKQEYLGAITLGSFVEEATQYAYYAWEGDTAPTQFTYPGPVNEAIKIYGDATHGNFDNRTTKLTLYIRPAPTGTSGNVVGYTFDESSTIDIGASSVTYQAYRFPLSSSVDLNLSLTDAEITALETAKSLTITWYGSDQASNTFLPFDLAGGPYNFRVIINGDGTVSTTEFYNWVQWSLRQAGDIDDGAGTEYGFSTPALLTFVGSTLQTFDIDPDVGLGGVALDGFDTNFANDIQMRDNSGTLRSFPYVAAGKISANTNLIEDAAAKYWMFFTTNPGGDFGTANAILVDNNSGTDITGDLHYIQATPATGSATGTSNGSASASGSTMTVTSAGWTVNDFQGKVLVVTSGSNAGYYWIASNTADTITITTAFEATDAAMSWVIRNKNTSGEIGWDFDYTNNVQGGRTGDSDAPVTIIGLGLNNAQYVRTTGTIQKATGQNFSLVSALERNFSDPV